MAGMGDGYVGTAQDAARIRRLEKQREVERRRIQELKNKSSGGQTGLLQFGSSTSEILENAFRKETVGLVTREQYVEKRVNIRSKVEEEEKEKLQKLQQEEEELEKQKRKKRRAKAPARLSFVDDMEDTDEDSEAADNIVKKSKLGKDPTVETSFLPDRYKFFFGKTCCFFIIHIALLDFFPRFTFAYLELLLVWNLTYFLGRDEDNASEKERQRSRKNENVYDNNGLRNRNALRMNPWRLLTAIGMVLATGGLSRFVKEIQ
eukprot:TRINITY_DN693_c0_g1_i3.p1 TRINITY_DN693_c0_g1~~TRINITY_DN693_c0_g1_i3.p1  ORF type:complete len:262 (-),score=44.75 TRINITY_DN693_c0_g1_i3:902-1687(-)